MGAEARSWGLAIEAAEHALWKYDDVTEWLTSSLPAYEVPVAVDAWVFTEDFGKVLLIRHRWRGWVPPGGKVEPGEDPWDAVRREVREEAGIDVQPGAWPAAAAVRAFHADWSPTLALSYAAVVVETACEGEAGQPAKWAGLRRDWATYFPDDHARIRRHSNWLRHQQAPGE